MWKSELLLQEYRAAAGSSSSSATSRESLLEAIKTNSKTLKQLFRNSDFKEDEEVVLKIVKPYPRAIYLSQLKKNREFVLKAVAENGLCLKWVGKQFQSDPEIVSAAVKNNARAMEFVAPKLNFSKVS